MKTERAAPEGHLAATSGGQINSSGNAASIPLSGLTATHCASCGAPCGSDAVYCLGNQLPDGTIDYREGHALCGCCVTVLLASPEGCEATCRRIERTLAWRGHG